MNTIFETGEAIRAGAVNAYPHYRMPVAYGCVSADPAYLARAKAAHEKNGIKVLYRIRVTPKVPA